MGSGFALHVSACRMWQLCVCACVCSMTALCPHMCMCVHLHAAALLINGGTGDNVCCNHMCVSVCACLCACMCASTHTHAEARPQSLSLSWPPLDCFPTFQPCLVIALLPVQLSNIVLTSPFMLSACHPGAHTCLSGLESIMFYPRCMNMQRHRSCMSVCWMWVFFLLHRQLLMLACVAAALASC